MDVTAQSFSYHLPRILEDLSSCCFVALDFEFSGIGRIVINTAPPSAGRQELQDRYAEIKLAAEKYSIVQIGLTICHEEPETAVYTLKPFNFYLSPIIDKRFELERDCTFQSVVMEFLLGNKFSLDSLYRGGIPYLSREEDALAIAKARDRRARQVTQELEEDEAQDSGCIQFQEAVRNVIDAWLAAGTNGAKFLHIPPANGSSRSDGMPVDLNRHQKRLVHRLLETEYPSLTAISKPTYLRLVVKDENREESIREERVKRTRQRISKHTGFRWIVEALAGGDLTDLDTGVFTSILSNTTMNDPDFSLKGYSDNLKQRLKSRRPILVGHNLFADLIYLWKCFFGPLPDRVEDFQRRIHDLFPMLVDTKYMATHDCGTINPISSLAEINDNLSDVKIPKIVIDAKHDKYNTQKAEHEAGYDSLLTAQVFIKLSAQLRDGGASKQLKELSSSPLGPVSIKSPKRKAPPEQDSAETSLNGAAAHHALTKMQKTSLAKDPDVLRVQSIAENASVSLQIPVADSILHAADTGQVIPRPSADFWKVYGNTLRVFGTRERVCVLGEKSTIATLGYRNNSIN